MVEKIKSYWPDWLKASEISAIISILATLILITVWVTTKGITTDNTALALAGINSRLDRVFTKLDDIEKTLPVMQERLAQHDAALSDGRGVWNGMGQRMGVMEQNGAALHAENEANRVAIETLSRRVR